MMGFVDYISNIKSKVGGKPLSFIQDPSNKICNNDLYKFIKDTLCNTDEIRCKNFYIVYEILLDSYNQSTNFHDKFICIILITFILEYEYYLIMFKDNKLEYGYNIKKEFKGSDPCLATYEEYTDKQELKIRFDYDYNGFKIKSLYSKSDKLIHYRSIIKHLSSNFDLLLDYFCEKIDDFFQKFINLLVKNLKKKYNNIESIILKDQKKGINIDNIDDNWLDKIEDKQYIDSIIKETIEIYHQNKNEYIADGNCFFSWLFIFYKDHQQEEKNKKNPAYLDYYGSCITSSLLEQFLLMKIHIPIENIYLILQNQIDIDDKDSELHDYHNLTQQRLKHFIENKGMHFYTKNSKKEKDIYPGYGISHWATIFKNVGNNDFSSFRVMKNNKQDKYIIYPKINIKTNPKEYFIAFVYECFDYYTQLMIQNKNIFGNEYIINIETFFEQFRIKLFDNKI